MNGGSSSAASSSTKRSSGGNRQANDTNGSPKDGHTCHVTAYCHRVSSAASSRNVVSLHDSLWNIR